MSQKVYVILHADGTIGVFRNRMGRHYFGKLPRQFECDYALTLDDLCEWQGENYTHHRFEEIGFED